MQLFIDDTGSVSPNDKRSEYFGFVGMLVNDDLAVYIEQSYKEIKRLHNFPEEFKLNEKSKEISYERHQELKIIYKTWLRWIFDNLESTPMQESEGKLYHGMHFVINIEDKLDKNKYKVIYEKRISELEVNYPWTKEDIKSNDSKAYNATLIRTIIDSLACISFIVKPNLSNLDIKIDKNPYQDDIERYKNKYRSFYLGCKNVFEKYYMKHQTISNQLPQNITVGFTDSEDSYLVQLAHNIAYLGRMEEWERRGRTTVHPSDRFCLNYKGLFLRDDGMVKSAFDFALSNSSK